MNRIVAVLVCFLFFVAACGVDRASEDTLAEDADPASNSLSTDGNSDADGGDSEVDQTDGADTDSTGGTAAPTPTTLAPPTVAPPTTGVADDVAMRVDFGDETWEITHGELNEVVVATQENQEFVDLVFGGVIPPGFTAGVLTEHLVSRALELELAEAGGELTDAAIEDSRLSLISTVELQLYAGQPDAAASAAALYDEAPYLPFLTEYQARQDVLSTLLAEAGADNAPQVPCVRHILVETEAEGDTILTRLDAGEDFSELAIELSTGPSGPSGGELGCVDASGYVPEFRDAVNAAEVDEVVGPVMTQFGWHVLVVDGYEAGVVDGRTLASQQLEERLAAATVEVDEKLGTWDSVQLAVLPADL